MEQSISMNMVQAAYDLADSRQMCCRADLDLLLGAMDCGPRFQRVVQLGAGSGTMALAILGHKKRARLITIEHNDANINWEGLALKNAGLPKRTRRYRAIQGKSAARKTVLASGVKDLDLLVVDADHSYKGVKADLKRWLPVLRTGGLIFLHDYDGTTAPNNYPGVKQAADEVLRRTPVSLGGWSAVFVK